jgi:hypothetical protein
MYQSVVMNPMNQFPFPNPRLPLLAQFAMTPLLPVAMLVEAMASISLAISHRLLILKLRDLETLRGSGRPRVGKTVYSGSSSVWNRCGNPYLPKGITKESEVADTKGSTATGAPL